MTSHIAMLRGINVSGQKAVKMGLLRASFAALGFTDVQTYIQSGNVVFTAPAAATASLTRKIEEKILRDFGFAVPVLVRTAGEMATIVRQNSFVRASHLDQTKLHVTFLAGDPPPTAAEKLQPFVTAGEQFRIIGREIYLYCPHGYGNTKLSNLALERKLSLEATTRNWRTVNTLLTMAQ